jgi:hypothetical protein
MVAHTQPTRGLLLITFSSDGEEPETHQAIDGGRAAATAITMIAARLTTTAGRHRHMPSRQ